MGLKVLEFKVLEIIHYLKVYMVMIIYMVK